MKECSESIARRLADPNFLTRYFRGRGIDIGGAPDPLSVYAALFPLLESARTWDLDDGDGQFLEGIADESFDFVDSSHCLEHLADPREGLHNWCRAVKQNGYLVVSVPYEDLHEQRALPSEFNKDHKWASSMYKEHSWSERSIDVIDLLRGLGPAVDLVRIQLFNSTYRCDLPRYDQTLTPVGE